MGSEAGFLKTRPGVNRNQQVKGILRSNDASDFNTQCLVVCLSPLRLAFCGTSFLGCGLYMKREKPETLSLVTERMAGKFSGGDPP